MNKMNIYINVYAYKYLATTNVKPISQMINNMIMLDLSAYKTKRRLLNTNIYIQIQWQSNQTRVQLTKQ